MKKMILISLFAFAALPLDAANRTPIKINTPSSQFSWAKFGIGALALGGIGAVTGYNLYRDTYTKPIQAVTEEKKQLESVHAFFKQKYDAREKSDKENRKKNEKEDGKHSASCNLPLLNQQEIDEYQKKITELRDPVLPGYFSSIAQNETLAPNKMRLLIDRTKELIVDKDEGLLNLNQRKQKTDTQIKWGLGITTAAIAGIYGFCKWMWPSK